MNSTKYESQVFWHEAIARFLEEDDINQNFFQFMKTENDLVRCHLKFKSDGVICGLIPFFETFQYLGANFQYQDFLKYEGESITKKQQFEIVFNLPYNVAISGERVALNLLSRASAVATYTNQFVQKTNDYNIKILETRKTTPGLRTLEKYAVRVGGGANHRFSTTDCLMIKDNHKVFYGGLTPAYEKFKELAGFYQPIIAEIHNLDELKTAINLKVNHIMLDNFSINDLKDAIKMKPENMTYEVSGGINLTNIQDYMMKGIDALSIGGLTHNPPPFDISMKVLGRV